MYTKKTKITIWSLLVLGLLFLLTECYLRAWWGFCDTVLMQADSDYEYIAKPNQQRYRFRNHITYNSLSMRSNEIDTTALIILGFGDSVLNGGVLTDHDSLATTLLTQKLSSFFNQNIQFLNISAGSWGPDNCFAYLNKHGNFDAKYILLFVSSHDAYDNMNFEPIVGLNESFPDKQYKLAWAELINRYLLPKIGLSIQDKTYSDKNLGINKQSAESQFNTGFAEFFNYCTQKKIPFILFLHADRIELSNGKYNQQGQKIISFANEHNIPLIMDLKNDLSVTEYRTKDIIHLNNYGQKQMCERVFNHLKTNHLNK